MATDAFTITLEPEDGTTGAAEIFHNDLLAIRCAKAYPPGKPLVLTLATSDGPLPLCGRCIGSRQQPEGDYAVRLRLTNLRKQARRWLCEHLAPASASEK